MPDHDLIAESRQLVASIPEDIGVLRSLDATRLARARMLLGELADELEYTRALTTESEAESNRARAQFGLLFDALAERGARFDTDQGRVVAVQLPSLDELRSRIAELEQQAGAAIGWKLAIAARNNELEQYVAARDQRITELEQQTGQFLGYVVVLKDSDGDLTCVGAVFDADGVRTAVGIGEGYAMASDGEDEYLIAELREVSDR